MSQEAKPPVRIRMTIGNVEFEIECREDQIEEVVRKVLSTVTEHADRTQALSRITEPSTRAETCKGVIQNLWREGWFTSPKSLGDVHNEMMRIGFHYDRTAVAHTLLDMVKEGLLTRVGKPRRYLYAQKRPLNIS